MTQTARDEAIAIIRDRIHTQGINPQVLAKRAGLGHDTIYRWLSGEREPRLSDLEKALSTLGYRLTIAPAF